MRTASRSSWFFRHPFATASLLCHAMLLTVLSFMSWTQRDAAMRSFARSEIQRSEDTRLRRLIDQMTATEKALQQVSGVAKPAEDPADQALDSLKKAKKAAERLDRQVEAVQVQKLAELLKISPAEAQAKLREEGMHRPPRELASADDISRKEQEAAALLNSLKSGVAVKGGASGDEGISGVGTGIGILSGSEDRRVYGAYRAPPAVAREKVRRGVGRSFGQGGVFASRIFIDSWYLIGPFEGRSAASLATPYPPETEIDLDAAYLGKGGRLLKWRYQQAALYPLIPPDAAENAVWFGYTELSSDRERDILLSIGADDDAKVWLNGQRLWTSGGGDKPWYHTHFNNLRDDIEMLNLTEQVIQVHLHAGANPLMFKLYNGSQSYMISLVLSNP